MPGKNHELKYSDSPPKAGAGTVDGGIASTGSSRGNIEDFKPGSTVSWPDKAQGKIPKAL